MPILRWGLANGYDDENVGEIVTDYASLHKTLLGAALEYPTDKIALFAVCKTGHKDGDTMAILVSKPILSYNVRKDFDPNFNKRTKEEIERDKEIFEVEDDDLDEWMSGK